MSSDGYVTSDLFFACGLCYVFGDEALTKIEVVDHREKRFTLDILSLDAEAYHDDFKAGNFAISDLKSYVRTYSWATRILKTMTRDGETEWMSPSWIAGRNSKEERVS